VGLNNSKSDSPESLTLSIMEAQSAVQNFNNNSDNISNGRGPGRRRQNRPRRAHEHPPLESTPESSRPTQTELSRGSSSRGQPHTAPRGRGNARGNIHAGIQGAQPVSQETSRTLEPSFRRGRGRGIRTGRHGHSSIVSHRQFAGQLSRDVDEEGSQNSAMAASGLSADAPVFTPGSSSFKPQDKPQQQSRAPKGKAPQKPKRKMSMSSAPDLSTRIHEDIDHQVYECAVCTEDLHRRARVWFCRQCWSVFHLKCIQKWAKSKTDPNSPQNTETTATQWRCPGCNLEQENFPSNFTCWCEKEIDPPSLAGLPPFSCGQTCNRQRSCPHACPEVCHAGPCRPCTQMGPAQSCFCGREVKTKRCMETDYKNGWSCGQVCNELMPCGEHYCGRPCHEGLCGACEVPVEGRCYCGGETTEILCCDRGEERKSAKRRTDGESVSIERWIGLFDCGNVCNREFDCGKHRCQKPCHPQDETIAHCPRSPNVVSHCPCGKTPLLELSSVIRTSCEDDIPLCPQPCLKELRCEHKCQQICHTDECAPCTENVEVNCCCGRTKFKKLCYERDAEELLCDRVCHTNLNCGRHECGSRCCSGEKKATERLSSKKKQRIAQSLDPRTLEHDIEAEHICTRVCGRPLKCGNHTCEELCHRGPCSTCREAIFDEISCHCGRTIRYPPLPCGSKPPPCRFPCQRTPICGHPAIEHACHLDDEKCPKCPYHVTKVCLCGKNQLKNQLCSVKEARCGEVCNKKLKCGYHTCRKTCHRLGECEDAGIHCPQQCGKEKSCGHPCSDPCHSPFPCKEEKACQHKIFITCSCQRIKSEAKCLSTKGTPGNTQKSIPCDDECLRLQRNHKLQLALNIDPTTHTDSHIPYSSDTLASFTSLEQTWAQAQEKQLRDFAADPDAKRLRFKPMKRNHRAFIHSLAEDFGFDSESLDPEPHRHVALFKTPRFVAAPMKTLTDCVRIRHRLRTEAAADTSRSNALAALTAGDKESRPMNALLLTNLRFGLTTEELREALTPALHTPFAITFLTHAEEAIISFSSHPANIPLNLPALKLAALRALAKEHLASVQFCRIPPGAGSVASDAGHVELRESDVAFPSASSNAAGEVGWSRVAAKAAAQPRRVGLREPVVSRSSFVVLGSGAGRRSGSGSTDGGVKSEKGKGKKVEKVADSWEEEVEKLEELEGMEKGEDGGKGAREND
jgi:transcriptional repressor NF-X1